MNLPEYQTNKLTATHFLEIAEKYGIYYTIHLDENLNPCDFNNEVAAAYIETVLQTIEAAKRLSVPVLNMHLHSGVWFTLPHKKVFLFDEYEQEYIRKLTDFRDVCTVAVGDADIKICVENCGDYGDKPYLRKGLALLLESPAFALTFDIGHNAAADYVDEPTIMEHIESLYHMHIHDASGHKNHLKLGDGDVDIAKYLDLAKEHDCRAVLEVKTVDGLRQSVDWLKAGGYT
jgi:sugar phosphate isomerase/epimerase